MIDPKLNELPIDPDDEIINAELNRPTGTAAVGSTPRRGLSINDTIGGTASLSTGARGVDTSGVRAGAGAGAGMTNLTAGQAGESPSPQVVGGARGSGTTVLGANDSVTTGSTVPGVLDEQTGLGSGTATQGSYSSVSTSFPSTLTYGTESDLVGHESEISARAYQIWCERGRPQGSPEVDWHLAVEEYRATRGQRTRSAGNY